MKLAAICCTYNRPHLLPHAIESFLRQDYPAELRELIILDDAGQYDPSACDHIPGVRLVVVPERYATLGAKRNASVAFASLDTEAFCVWDDDDIHLPWHISAAATALMNADYTIPTRVIVDSGSGKWQVKHNKQLFHSAWSFRRSAFDVAGGYPEMDSGQDQAFRDRMDAVKLRRADPIQFDPRPSYIYRWSSVATKHISAMDRKTGYAKLLTVPAWTVSRISPHWECDWIAKVLPQSQLQMAATRPG